MQSEDFVHVQNNISKEKSVKKRVSGENLLIFMSEIDEMCCFEYKNAKTSKLKILQLWGFETQLTK